jgi:large subunit ribosomal protein L3
MATTRHPRRGTLQYAPRKRAHRMYPRVRSYPSIPDVKPIGFAGYKVGMTHIMMIDNGKTALMKGEEVAIPTTIIECPPLRLISIRLYKKTDYGLILANEIFSSDYKALARRLKLPKSTDATQKIAAAEQKLAEYAQIRINVCTQPELTTIGKKKPEVFELAIGGKDNKAKFDYAKQNLGKEIKAADVLKEGQQVDIHAVTKGHGYQGAVRRMGIDLKQHKSEKGVRTPGNVGPWNGNRGWTVPHAGQTGFHNRLQRNNWIVKIGDNPETVNPKGGAIRYGLVKNNFILIKGSVLGASKRLIRMTPAARPNKRFPAEAPSITTIDQSAKQ